MQQTKLKTALDDRGITHTKLAEITGYSIAVVWDLCNGRTKLTDERANLIIDRVNSLPKLTMEDIR